ncbi:ATP-dependent protease ATPase subunit HslU [Sediminispirochaeta smaragdinae]|jgi:ATP-dependent HslUV protease ATP-binding subunit HslU|uniref:ATP-dependent protease ATPase subunit HslU n=1 Tax=Sediminispirochaeta smaragdinae (strain DSM 11293 / JCM 15392 / SEBR 4228) TaxID=573413 RepID=E1R5S0_SEDSS|nr:ATP-dependent protease ATPase subunit HslU [Sediminispirochaeta smaragdinae]ADK80685.1 heat shock protein HslVU, ATPase subunit HslU [Sediminispirochaeta smaragdinae DSM 11293]
MKQDFDTMTPRQIVTELDKYIVGQEKAKKAVAIALRNRVRRRMLAENLRDEIAPKNIIMIGPTGVGKTEIARRLSRLSGAPFIKVEATKYTEVGYVGRDVESMVRDLMAVSLNMVKAEMSEGVKEEAENRAEEALLDLLLPGIGGDPSVPEVGGGQGATREKFRTMLREGKLDDKLVEVQVSGGSFPTIEVFSGQSPEAMDVNFGNLGSIFGGGKKRKRVRVEQAKKILLDEEMDKLIDTERAGDIARERCEQMGIIFIDEIDKVAVKSDQGGADVSREGVQRDILPIVEGSTVNTKYGMIDTSHILFIAAGAFHTSKPSDLIPELQGRFPLRVELDDLDADDFVRILTEPENALTRQYIELLKTEGVDIEFTDPAIRKLSEIAAEVNARTENIGARRLHTIMELLLEEVSFTAPELKGQKIPITPEYVESQLGDIVQDQDLARYIL